MPAFSEIFSTGLGLRAGSEQQQQEQQQQQQQRNLRRFLNLETELPEEEVVTRLSSEIREVNRIAPRQ
jgi:hypothetical protein